MKNAMKVLKNAEVIIKMPQPGTVEQIRGIITEVTGDTVTVTEILSDKAVEEGKTPRVIKGIPKASAETLILKKNPNVPEVEIEDGVMTVDGSVVRTGFEVNSSIVTLPNRAYVTVKAEDSDRVDVYSYDVAGDKFYKVTSKPLALINADEPKQIGSSVIIPYLNKHTEEEEITKEDGTKEKVEYEVLEETGYLLISTNSGMASVVPTELSDSGYLDFKTEGDNVAYFVTTSSIQTASAALDYGCDDYDDDYDGDDNDDDDYEDTYDTGRSTRYVSDSGRITPREDGKIRITMYRVEGRHLVQMGASEMEGEYVSVVYAGRTIVVKTTKAIHVDVCGRTFDITDKTALKALEGYTYVVKNEMKNGVLKIWFVNDKYEQKVYSVTPAEDARGPIIEVQ